MVKALTDNEFSAFINGSFYSAVGFYHPNSEAKDAMLSVLNEFTQTHGNVDVGTLDISANKSGATYGVSEAIGPIVVVFKQGTPFKAFTSNLTVDTLAVAMAAPGKNITLQ